MLRAHGRNATKLSWRTKRNRESLFGEHAPIRTSNGARLELVERRFIVRLVPLVAVDPHELRRAVGRQTLDLDDRRSAHDHETCRTQRSLTHITYSTQTDEPSTTSSVSSRPAMSESPPMLLLAGDQYV